MRPGGGGGGSRAAPALERRSTSIARSGARAARAMDARGASAHVVGLLLLCLLGPRAADGGRTRLVAAGDHDGDVARAGRRGTARAHGRTCERPDRKSVVSGKSVSGRVELGGRGILKK